MISNLDAGAKRFLGDIGRVQRRIAEAGAQVSSGKKFVTASDAPDQVQALLQLRAERARNTQIQANLAMAGTEAASADAALTDAIKLMDRARVLAAQGGTAMLDASTRRSLALESQTLLEQMVVDASASVQGRYIFSGDQDASPAYQVDLTLPEGVVQLSASSSTRRIEHPAGGSFAASLTAPEVFDTRDVFGNPAADNVFAALNSLRVALETGDTAAVTSTGVSIVAASQRLNTSQAFYGNVERRIQDAAKYASSYDIRLQAQLSEKEDADVAAAAVELTQANTQLQAAFQMRAKLPTSSLFDYLA
jgi:flagellar hook-associated protein 3 FlgL